MRRHFFRSLSEDSWQMLRSEVATYSDPSAAVAMLMSKFRCPYTRHIPADFMEERQR